MRGRLLAYARYQLADFLLLRASLPIGIALLFGFMIWWPTESRQGHAFWTKPPWGPQQTMQLYTMLLSFYLALGAFLGAARIVPEERSNGYFRFIFSKPVSLTGFYTQQWLVHGLAFSGLAAGLAWLISVATAPVPIFGAFVAGALTWILIGGVGFLLGAITNFDALLLLLVWVGSQVLHAIKKDAGDKIWPWLREFTRAAPPTHKLSYLHDVLYEGSPMHWPNFWFVVAYGLAAFALGLVVLRRTSLSR